MICVNVYSENCILNTRYDVSSSDYINSYLNTQLKFHLNYQNHSQQYTFLYFLLVYFCPLRALANTLFPTKKHPLRSANLSPFL